MLNYTVSRTQGPQVVFHSNTRFTPLVIQRTNKNQSHYRLVQLGLVQTSKRLKSFDTSGLKFFFWSLVLFAKKTIGLSTHLLFFVIKTINLRTLSPQLLCAPDQDFDVMTDDGYKMISRIVRQRIGT